MAADCIDIVEAMATAFEWADGIVEDEGIIIRIFDHNTGKEYELQRIR